jgi:DNA-binding transcriptional regulator YdaS (Cro superfamily)
MPLSGEALNEQLQMLAEKKAAGINIAAVSIAKNNGEVSVETETAASGHKFKKTAHGLATKDIVVLTELNGKTGLGETVGGLVVGAPYYIHEVSSSEFALAYTKAQSESATEGEWVEYTAAIKTTTKVTRIKEATVAARIAITFSAAKNLLLEDATAREIESTEAAQKIKWVVYYSATSAGTFMGVEAATEKELASGDLYKVTSSKISQNAYLV